MASRITKTTGTATPKAQAPKAPEKAPKGTKAPEKAPEVTKGSKAPKAPEKAPKGNKAPEKGSKGKSKTLAYDLSKWCTVTVERGGEIPEGHTLILISVHLYGGFTAKELFGCRETKALAAFESAPSFTALGEIPRNVSGSKKLEDELIVQVAISLDDLLTAE